MRERVATPLNYFFRASALLAAMALLGVMATASGAAEGDTTRVSIDSSGNQAKGDSSFPRAANSSVPSMSSEGRFVAFASGASNLAPNDTNHRQDIFVRDRRTGTTERVSVNNSGNQANESSHGPAISADGRFVAFFSFASNLVANDTNETWDVFVHDRQTDTTELVSVNSSGEQADRYSWLSSISSDGRFVVFQSFATNLVANDTNASDDIFVRDLQAGTTERVSVDSSGNQAKGYSYRPSISPGGRFVFFNSEATNLVANDTNGAYDVFVRDRRTGTTERVNVDSSGNQANAFSQYRVRPSISSDGRFVAFHSYASNLVPRDTNESRDVFVHERDVSAP